MRIPIIVNSDYDRWWTPRERSDAGINILIVHIEVFTIVNEKWVQLEVGINHAKCHRAFGRSPWSAQACLACLRLLKAFLDPHFPRAGRPCHGPVKFDGIVNFVRTKKTQGFVSDTDFSKEVGSLGSYSRAERSICCQRSDVAVF